MKAKKIMTGSTEKSIDKRAEVKASKEKRFKNILIRIPIGVLTEVDEWIQKKPWLNRTQWIVQAIYKKLVDESDGKAE
jgi:hypothetical protein